METYRFVTNLVLGRQVRLHYLRTGIVAGNMAQQLLLPFCTVTLQEWREWSAEKPLAERPFRIIRDIGKHLELQWADA